MDKIEQLDKIADHCLAAHRSCGDDQPALREILEVALLEVGFRIAALQKEHDPDPDLVDDGMQAGNR
jgi:hypothetical protein